MNLSYWLIIFGVILMLVGLLSLLGVPFGKLPGDIHIKGERSDVYFPIVTSIIVSVVLTVILNIFFWLFKK